MTIPKAMAVALEAVAAERERQERLRLAGRFAHTCASTEISNAEKLAVLVEEVGEVARAVLEAGNLASDKHERDLREELIQVAAVAVAWAESLGVPEGGPVAVMQQSEGEVRQVPAAVGKASPAPFPHLPAHGADTPRTPGHPEEDR